MDSLLQDLRFTLRLIQKQRGSTLLAITALVLGIGLNTAIFSVLNAVVLRPLPIFQPDRLVWLHSKVNQTGAPLGTSYPDFLDWQSQNHSFVALAAMYALSFTLTGNGPPEHVKASAISASAFRVWGVGPILGRDFTDQDDRSGATRVAILNYPLWQRKYGGDPNILGKPLVLDDQHYTIVGVLQPTPLGVLRYPNIYVANGPLIDAHIMERDTRWFFPVGRLKPNITQSQAQAEMDTIAARLAIQYPATNKDMGIRLQSMVEQLTADGRKPLMLLGVAAGLILLLAAINVMTVFLGNAVGRTQEMSLRLLLGATRASLMRQLFVHALTFALIAGSLGLLVAKLALAFFLHRFPSAFLRFQETTIDFNVLVATVAATLLTSIIAMLLSASYTFNLNPQSQLTGQWISFTLPKYRVLARTGLIIFEVSLASALAIISGLLIKSFYAVEKIDLGFNPSRVLSFQINPSTTRYKEPTQQISLSKATLEKLRSLPGMQSMSAISALPLTTQGQVNTLEVDAQSPVFGQKLLVEDEAILPGLFQTFQLPILQGRDFSENDHEGTPPVIIVDDVLAAKLWPNQNPLGKKVRMSIINGETVRWLEVVGVVKEIKHFGPEKGVRWMQVYVPQYQDPSQVLSFVVNTTLPESAVKTATEKALHDLDTDLPVENFESMDAYLDTFLSGRKISILLLSSFAAIAIVLGAIGTYGVVANSVVQRQKEIAIRMAVGATPLSTIVLIIRVGVLATLAGLAIGSATVISLTRLLSSLLFGITVLDPTIYISSGIVLIILALAASFTPAFRLTRLNIQNILRQ